MSIFDTAIVKDSWVTLEGICRIPIHVKLEGGQPSGSIKMKTALGLFRAAEVKGLIGQKTTIVESSSGNLGVALAMICASKGIKFRCFVDPNISTTSASIMKSLGADLEVVEVKDANGGYLGSRILALKAYVSSNEHALWLNQYTNPSGPLAHYETTAKEIHGRFPNVAQLFVGAGTTGTVMGCAKYFRDNHPETKVIAVDVDGSVTFGAEPKARRIPGLGTSKKPEIAERSLLDGVIFVDEISTILMCRKLAKTHGIIFGGSTGSVLAGISACNCALSTTGPICAISPDFGEKYLGTIYDDDWVITNYQIKIAELRDAES